MDKKMFRDIIYPIVILGLICLVVTLLLALTNSMTKDLIMNNSIDREAAKEVLKIESDNFSVGKLSEMAYEITENGNLIGYVFLTETDGYGGPINLMTGLNPDGTVSGIKVLSNSETPGLGGRIQEQTFLGQFLKNKFIDKFVVVKNNAKNDNEIQALTSATISSRAVVDSVNKSIDEFKRLKGGHDSQ